MLWAFVLMHKQEHMYEVLVCLQSYIPHTCVPFCYYIHIKIEIVCFTSFLW